MFEVFEVICLQDYFSKYIPDFKTKMLKNRNIRKHRSHSYQFPIIDFGKKYICL